jgi:hypothetical protein
MRAVGGKLAPAAAHDTPSIAGSGEHAPVNASSFIRPVRIPASSASVGITARPRRMPLPRPRRPELNREATRSQSRRTRHRRRRDRLDGASGRGPASPEAVARWARSDGRSSADDLGEGPGRDEDRGGRRPQRSVFAHAGGRRDGPARPGGGQPQTPVSGPDPQTLALAAERVSVDGHRRRPQSREPDPLCRGSGQGVAVQGSRCGVAVPLAEKSMI